MARQVSDRTPTPDRPRGPGAEPKGATSVVLGGRYRLRRQIAAGGMGTVWEGEDLALGRPVAVKLLSDALAADPGIAERFRREARAAAGLTHPNVARVLDYGEDAQTRFIVMELLRGETLAAQLVRGPLPPAEAAAVAAEIADALAAAHATGVIHRDVKPANVMLTPEGVRVMDFGIAAAGWDDRLTATGDVIGTPAYLAPERVAGAPANPAADVYGLGLVLYEMLAGRPPFHGPTPLATALAHVHEAPPPLEGAAPGIPPALGAACLRALAKDPGDRTTSAAAFAAEVRGAAGLPASPAAAPARLPVANAEAEAATVPVLHGATLPIGVVPEAPDAAREPATGEPARPRPRRTPRWLRAAGGWIRTAAVAGAVTLAALLLASLLLAGRHHPRRAAARTSPRPGSAASASPSPRATASPSPSPTPIAVPDVRELQLAQAEQALLGLGLQVGPIVVVPGPHGVVLGSQPAPGSTTAPGTPVTLFIGGPPGHGNGNGNGQGGEGGNGG